MAGLIDPTKTGKYPVILGDSLKGKGKGAESVYTAIKYNHKPNLTSPNAPKKARLKPSVPGNTSSYDLNYVENNLRYGYSGTRDTDDKKYVLHFDPKRKAFILDKADSTFNLNATRLPLNAERQYPHMKPPPKPSALPNKPTAAKSGPSKPNPLKQAPAKPAPAKTGPLRPPPKPRAKPILPPKKEPAQRKPEKKAPPKPVQLNLPVPAPPKPENEKPKEKEKEKPKHTGFEEDDDDDDDDGGLLVEYPDGDPRTKPKTGFSPAFPAVRRFDDFMNQRESEEDPDSEDMDVIGKDIQFPVFDPPQPVQDTFKPPPPPPRREPIPQPQPEPEPMVEEDSLEDDLAKDLEMAFDLENSQDQIPDDESEISEED